MNIKLILSLFIFLITGFLLFYLYPKGNIDSKLITGIVTSKSENSYILLTLKGKYYVQDLQNEYNIFSIIKIEGYASKLEFSHYEGSFDFKSYLNSKGVYLKFDIIKKEELFLNRINFNFIYDYSKKYLNNDSRELFNSFLFSKSITSNNLFVLKDLGLTSYLTVSGFHISIFLNFIMFFFSTSFRKKYGKRIKISILSIFLFLTSFSFAIRRLLLLNIIPLLLKRIKKYEFKQIECLSICCILILTFEPYIITNSCFYFPFPLLFYLALFKKKNNGLKSKILNSISIYLFFLPYQISYNKSLSLLSCLFQFLLIPYSHFLFIASLLLVIIPPFGFIYNYLVKFVLFMANGVAKYNFYISANKFFLVFIIIYYLLYIGISILKTYNYKRFIKPFLCLYSIPFLLLTSNIFYKGDKITFIDVDQGDCTLLRYKKYNILFDTGGKKNVDLATKCLIPYFRKENIRQIDYIFLTHLDYDHYGALNSLLLNFKVYNVIYNNDFNNENNYEYKIDDLIISNLNKYQISTDTNDNSAVYYFKVNEKKILIQGDAPKEIENKILKDNPTLKTNIIKLGHHGSKTSSNKKYLETINPEVAIISAGLNNSYKLPNKETLVLLNSLKINYHRTDLEGSITFKL